MKGIVPIILAIVIGALALYGILCAYVFGSTVIDSQSQIENTILSSINQMEYFKREIPVAMQYSFYQSSYDVAGRGGNLASGTSYNCIAYWNIFGQDTIPDYQANANKAFLNIFSKYLVSMSNSAISLPNFQVNEDVSSSKLTISSNELLTITNAEFYTVSDSSTFSVDISPDTMGIFNAGKDVASQAVSTISSSSSYSDALSKLIDLQTTLNAKYSGHYDVIIQPEGNLGTGSSTFAFRTLVIVVDVNNKYPIYDFSANKNDYKSVALSFYLLEGTDTSVTPQVNGCSSINY